MLNRLLRAERGNLFCWLSSFFIAGSLFKECALEAQGFTAVATQLGWRWVGVASVFIAGLILFKLGALTDGSDRNNSHQISHGAILKAVRQPSLGQGEFLTFKRTPLLVIAFLCMCLSSFGAGHTYLSWRANLHSSLWLQTPLKFAHIKGRVVRVHHKEGSKFSQIELVNSTILNYLYAKNSPELKPARLRPHKQPFNVTSAGLYLGKLNLTIRSTFLPRGAEVTCWAHLKPPAEATPKARSLLARAFWSDTVASGFIFSHLTYVGASNSRTDLKRSTLLKGSSYLASTLDAKEPSPASFLPQSFGGAKRTLFQRFKQWAMLKIETYFPAPLFGSADNLYGLAQAMTLGIYEHVPENIKRDLVNSGLWPFAAISGLHIGLISGIVFYLFRLSFLLCLPRLALWHKKLAALGSILVIIAYLLTLEELPSAWRAGLMCILVMLGVLGGFKVVSIRNVYLVALILLIISPGYICSVSFWLSLIATLSIIYLYSWHLLNMPWKFKSNHSILAIGCTILNYVLKIVWPTLLISTAVGLILMPILVYYFSSASLYTFVSHLLVTPVFAIFILPPLLLGLITPNFMAPFLFQVGGLGLSYMVWVGHLTSHFRYSVLHLAGCSYSLFYLFIFLCLLFFMAKSKPLTLLFLVLLGTVMVSCLRQDYPDIIIRGDGKMVAVKDLNGKYVLNNVRFAKFLQAKFVKDKNLIGVQNMAHSPNLAHCNRGECYIWVKNLKVALVKNSSYGSEGCSEVDVILAPQTFIPWSCPKARILDRKFFNLHGSTYIYLDKPRKSFKLLTTY